MSCGPRRGEIPRRAGTLSLSSVFAVSLREGTRRCGEPLSQWNSSGCSTPRDTALTQREALLRIVFRGGGHFRHLILGWAHVTYCQADRPNLDVKIFGSPETGSVNPICQACNCSGWLKSSTGVSRSTG